MTTSRRDSTEGRHAVKSETMTRPAATSETLSDYMVRDLLSRLRSNRPLEYLCRAWLQFGKDTMPADDVAKLVAAINARNGAKP